MDRLKMMHLITQDRLRMVLDNSEYPSWLIIYIGIRMQLIENALAGRPRFAEKIPA